MTPDHAALALAVRALPACATTRGAYADCLDEAGDHLAAARERVLACPESDARRLEFAQACERAGEVARAEFVRVQVELAQMDADAVGPVGPVPRESRYRTSDPRLRRLMNRERELYQRLSARDSHLILWQLTPPRGQFIVADLPDCRRGFVDSVPITAADWIQHGADIREKHPVTAVTLRSLPGVVSNAGNGWRMYGGASAFDGPFTPWRQLPVCPRTGRWQDALPLLLAVEYPGITFTLPP